MAEYFNIPKVRRAISEAIFSAASEGARRVWWQHRGPRQKDLAPITEFTKMRKHNQAYASLILVDTDKMVGMTRAERRSKYVSAVTNPHRLFDLHTFGGVIKFFGGKEKYLPGRDTLGKTIQEEEEDLLRLAEEQITAELWRPVTIRKVFG